MKKYLLLFSSSILMFFSVNAIHPLRQSILDKPNMDQMRDLYRSYTSQQKKIVWQDKINQVIELGSWNSSQLSLLQELKVKIDNFSFELNAPDADNVRLDFENWSNAALSVFTKVQIYNIVAVPNDFNNIDAPMGAGGNNDCECNKGSVVSCVFNLVSGCNKAACVPPNGASDGCGFLWNFKCDGKCIEDTGTTTSSPTNGK